MFGQVLGRDKGSMIAIELFLFHVVTGVPCVATWFSGFMQPLGRDRVFLVAIETVTTRGQVLQPSCCNRFGLGKGFYVATKYFYVAIEFGQGQGDFLSR